MPRPRKREKLVTPSPFHTSIINADKKVREAGFESLVFEELQKARGYTNERLRQFPVDDNRFFSLEDLDLDITVKIVRHKFDPDSIFNSANKMRALYDNEAADIVVLNDFDRQSYRGIALAALGVIYYEDMTGIITTIPNIDSSPIYLGRTVDLFESLVLAGHIPKWDGTFIEAD
jgi:hypothetical protein